MHFLYLPNLILLKLMITIYIFKDNTGDTNYKNDNNSSSNPSMGRSTNFSSDTTLKQKAPQEESFEVLLQKMKERLGSTNTNCKNKNHSIKL